MFSHFYAKMTNSTSSIFSFLDTLYENQYVDASQLTFVCSRLSIETLEKGVKYVQICATSMTLFWCFYS